MANCEADFTVGTGRWPYRRISRLDGPGDFDRSDNDFLVTGMMAIESIAVFQDISAILRGRNEAFGGFVDAPHGPGAAGVGKGRVSVQISC